MTAPEPTAWLDGRVLGAQRAEALYAEGGRVVALGSVEEVLRSVPTGAERIALHGRCVVPGLVDAHVHAGISVRARGSLDLSAVRSIRQLVDALDQEAGRRAGPIRGTGWDQEKFAEGRMPTRTDLDRVDTDQPIILYRHCDHVAAVNSAALELSGYSESTPDPPRGRLGRDQGSLNGLLYDGAMGVLGPLEDRWFPLDPSAMDGWLSGAAALGLTSLGAMSVEAGELRALRAALATDGAPVAVTAYVRVPLFRSIPELRPASETSSLRIAGGKVMLDGSLGARSANLRSAYSDAPGTTGDTLVSREELTDLLEVARSREAALAIHAIGDRALETALVAIGEVATPPSVRIEHASVAPPELLDRMRELRVPVVVQPSFVTSDQWIPERLGLERASWAYPFRSMLDRGILLAGSSDAPIESRDPWVGMAAAVAPRPRFGAGESISANEALQIYTTGGERLLGVTDGVPLSVGSPADLVVLSTPDFDAALRIGRQSVAATYRSGRCTFSAS